MTVRVRPRARIAKAAAIAALRCVCGLSAAPAEVPKGLETFDAVWKIVRDTHFDKTFNGVDWDAARVEFRPKAAAAATTTELRAVIHAMLGRLGQSHFSVIPGSAGENEAGAVGAATPGFDFRSVGRNVLVTRVEPGSSAAAKGIQTGWRLIAVGGRPVADVLTRLKDAPDERVSALEEVA